MNYLRGLLGSVTHRTCRYDHGPLQLQDGSFALVGLKPLQPRSAVGDLFPKPEMRAYDGHVLAVKAWRCTECGYIELVDEDA